jgi:hypothetical protein
MLDELENKCRAAYALNLCTVSVSQIIDYEDLIVLEQEYEAILNNLNLEAMPKDESLLLIIKQILDVITFFRIDKVERAFVEEEYNKQVRNAIWSAVPNFGMLIAGGNLMTAGIAIATQVGMGYMNYRNNRNEYQGERNRKLWQLQKAAIEQFNGLRRELFDTAWRLADKYEFPDKYRLTERQITNYNEILQDSNIIRRYERLDAIKEYFEAYPPFWYYLGSVANKIYRERKDLNCNHYKEMAIRAFEKYWKINAQGLLREDQVAAGCALEYIDILLDSMDTVSKIDRIEMLMRQAIEYSGRANDVLQCCAFYYLRINEFEKAAKLYKYLVNESYNTLFNAQILSSLYVRLNDQFGYTLLEELVDKNCKYLYPFKCGKSESGDKKFTEKLFNNLKGRCTYFFNELNDRYKIKFKDIFFGYLKSPNENKILLDDKFKENVELFFSSESNSNKAIFEDYFKSRSYGEDVIHLLNQYVNDVSSLSLFTKKSDIEQIKKNIEENLRGFYIEPEYSGDWLKQALKVNASFDKVLINTLSIIGSKFNCLEHTIDLSNIHILDEEITTLAKEKGIIVPVNIVNEEAIEKEKNMVSNFTLEFLGANAKKIQAKQKINNDLKQIIKNTFEGCNSINIIENINEFFSEHYIDTDALKQDAISIVELIDLRKYIIFSKSYFFVYRNNEHSELRFYDTGRQSKLGDGDTIINLKKPAVINEVIDRFPLNLGNDNINKLEASPDIIRRIWLLANEIVKYRDINKLI